MQISSWDRFSNEVYVSIFKYFTYIDLKKISSVSKQWREIATCDLLFKGHLKEIDSSVSEILNDISTPQLFYLFENKKFTFPAHKLPLTIECKTFDLGNKLLEAMLKLISECQLGIPKLQFWKPFPPHTFTIALGVYIAKIGQTYPKKEVYEASISYMEPAETHSLGIESSGPFFPTLWSETSCAENYSYSCLAYFWCGSLNRTSVKAISFNLSEGFSTAMKQIALMRFDGFAGR